MECAEIEKMYDIEKNHWWFAGKRNLIVSEIGDKSRGRLLDIGCGTGANLEQFAKHHRVIGCEVSKKAAELCRKRGDFDLVLCRAENLPFKKNTFDVVTALDVLEHIEDDESAMRNVKEIMKKGGSLVATVPAHMFMWSRHDVLLHHKRRYRYAELVKKLTRNGMKISKINYWCFFVFPGTLVYKKISGLIENKTNTDNTNRFVNSVLYRTLRIENKILKTVKLPFGVSIYFVAKNA